MAILKARLDVMDKAIEARLNEQMGRLVIRVAEMLEAERRQTSETELRRLSLQHLRR